MRRERGFTLVEVLVALGIVAIALVAGLQALCADNALTRVRLARQMPGVGESSSTCEQAGQSFEVALIVAPTPNPNFLRVDAQVRQGGQGLMRLSTIVGGY